MERLCCWVICLINGSDMGTFKAVIFYPILRMGGESSEGRESKALVSWECGDFGRAGNFGGPAVVVSFKTWCRVV